jgi:hypothetical protein
MKKYLISLSIVLFLNVPYFIGKLQFNNAVMVVQNLQDNEDDASIEATLRIFKFKDLTALDSPTFVDYYKCGVLTITN